MFPLFSEFAKNYGAEANSQNDITSIFPVDSYYGASTLFNDWLTISNPPQLNLSLRSNVLSYPVAALSGFDQFSDLFKTITAEPEPENSNTIARLKEIQFEQAYPLNQLSQHMSQSLKKDIRHLIKQGFLQINILDSQFHLYQVTYEHKTTYATIANGKVYFNLPDFFVLALQSGISRSKSVTTSEASQIENDFHSSKDNKFVSIITQLLQAPSGHFALMAMGVVAAIAGACLSMLSPVAGVAVASAGLLMAGCGLFKAMNHSHQLELTDDQSIAYPSNPVYI